MNTFKRKWLKSEVGFTLIEVLIATILFSLIALAFAASFMNGSVFMTNAGDRMEALGWAEGGVNTLKTKSYCELAALRNSSVSSHILLSNPISNPISSRLTVGSLTYKRDLYLVNVPLSDFGSIEVTPAGCPCACTGVDPPYGYCIRIDIIVSHYSANPKFEPVLLYTTICSTQNRKTG